MPNKGGQLKQPELKNPEDVGKTDDPRYCLYHRGLGHPTKSCWSLKDKLQALVDLKAENGAEDCHSQYDILHPVWPVASDSHHGVPHPCCRNEGYQLRPPSPTREGTYSHNHYWGWSNVDTPRPSR